MGVPAISSHPCWENLTTPGPLVVIPARGGSKRLPRKNALPLFGVPLIAYTIQAALAATRVERVVVSTDDAEIAAISREWGAEVIDRPAALSQDGSPIDDALKHALDVVTEPDAPAPAIIVWLQPDVPIRSPRVIDRAIGMLRASGEVTGVATGYKVTQHPAWMKSIDADGFLVPLNRDTSAFRIQDLPELFLFDGAVVAFHSANLRSLSHAGVHLYLGPKPRLLLQDHAMYSLNIDTAEQFELAEMYLTRFPEHRITPRSASGGPAA